MSRKHIFIAALALSAGTQAFAGGLLATLASPTLKQQQVLDGTVWNCAETTCRSASEPKNVAVAACKDIAKKFGQVVSFVSNEKTLDEEQLAKCNQSAK